MQDTDAVQRFRYHFKVEETDGIHGARNAGACSLIPLQVGNNAVSYTHLTLPTIYSV